MKKNLFLLSAAVAVVAALSAYAGNANGSAGDMPAYYDHQMFTINFKELPPGGEAANLQHNQSINIIYMSDAGLSNGTQPFISVLDAIQGDGFNPLWLEVQITFTAGHTPDTTPVSREITSVKPSTRKSSFAASILGMSVSAKA